MMHSKNLREDVEKGAKSIAWVQLESEKEAKQMSKVDDSSRIINYSKYGDRDHLILSPN